MRKKLFQTVTIMICLSICLLNSISVKATEIEDYSLIFEDTQNMRIVYDFEKYMSLLNSDTIDPFNATIIDGEFINSITLSEELVSPLDISDPSSTCSNILGHKWGSWGSWKEVSRVHFPSSQCYAKMERWRFCTRTHCRAYQIETDGVWVTCDHK